MNGQKEREVRRPFSSVPDIDAYYPSLSAETARSRLFRTLSRGEGIGILFGGTGFGKTLMLRLLADQFEMDAPVLFLSSARISSRKSLFRQLLFQLRTDASVSEEDELRIRFLDYLRNSDYARFILFVDNGDTLPISVLDEFRSLLDMEQGGIPRFRIAISGSARFEERLNLPRLAAFSQRIASRSWLDPFAREETAGYLERQMKRTAEEYGSLTFSPESAKLVQKLSDGVPRLINQICDLALYLSSASDKQISEKTVQKAWGLLQQIPDEDTGEDSVSEISDSEGVQLSGSETAETTTVEFGILGDDAESVSISEPAVSSLPEEKEILSDSAAESFDTKPICETGAVSSEDAESTFEFGSLEDETAESSDEDSDTETPECTEVSVDSSHIECRKEETAADTDSGNKSETWDADELVDETGADLTYDSMIREKLLQAFPEESMQLNETENSGKPEITAEESDPQTNLTSHQDRYMEELRLFEMEISQEADLVSKIKKMHTGLNSFRSEGISEPEQNTPVQSGTLPFSPQPEKSGESVSQSPAKKSPFSGVFEKIYTANRKKD